MMITKKALSRRTVLRGVGATLALPLLDSMVPAFTPLVKTAAKPTLRFGVAYLPNGVNFSGWLPKSEGRGFEFSPTLKPIERFRDQLVIVSGLDNDRIHGDSGMSCDEGGRRRARTAAGTYFSHAPRAGSID